MTITILHRVIALVFLLLAILFKESYISLLFIFIFCLFIIISLSKKYNLLFILVLNYLAHIIIIFYAYYFKNNYLILGQDELYFIEYARTIVNYGFFERSPSIGTGLFIYILSLFMKILGEEQVILQMVFSLFYVIYLYYVFKIIVDIFNVKLKYAYYFVLILGFSPPFFNYSLLFTREVVDLLCISIFVYYSYYFFEKKKFYFFVWGALSLLIVGAIDHKFSIISPLLFIIFIYSYSSYRKSVGKMLVIGFLALFTILSLTILPNLIGGHLKEASNQGVANYVDKRASQANSEARATYGSQINGSSMPALVASLPVASFYYLSTPFPWKIRTFGDMTGFIMVLIEFYFYFHAFKLVRKKNLALKKYISFLILVGAVILLVNALGTINWGTAFRHKTSHTWIFFILGIYNISLKKGLINRQ